MRSKLSKLITRAKELGIAGEQADEELVYERIRQYLDANPPKDKPALDRLVELQQRCTDFRPDHNGECLNCDDWADAHGPIVLNKRTDPIPNDAVYIGRPSKWGNPYAIGRHGDRDTVLRKFEAYIAAQPELRRQAREELRGRDLVCWCAPLPCHGDVLLRVANSEEE